MSRKEVTLYVRVAREMRQALEREAAVRGESISVIAREAFREYFDRFRKKDAKPGTLRPPTRAGGQSGRSGQTDYELNERAK
jgi:hypothetical protein